MNNIENKLNELECKCVEKYGEDKCYKIAFGVVVILFNIPTLLFVLSFCFFSIAIFKFAIMAEITMLIIVALMISNSNPLKGY